MTKKWLCPFSGQSIPGERSSVTAAGQARALAACAYRVEIQFSIETLGQFATQASRVAQAVDDFALRFERLQQYLVAWV